MKKDVKYMKLHNLEGQLLLTLSEAAIAKRMSYTLDDEYDDLKIRIRATIEEIDTLIMIIKNEMGDIA